MTAGNEAVWQYEKMDNYPEPLSEVLHAEVAAGQVVVALEKFDAEFGEEFFSPKIDTVSGVKLDPSRINLAYQQVRQALNGYHQAMGKEAVESDTLSV